MGPDPAILPDILQLTPNRVWRTYPGGRTLDQWQGEVQPVDSHFPEDWIASLVRANNAGRESMPDEGLSEVELAGDRHFLRDLLVAKGGASSSGPHACGTEAFDLPFLVKLLDSAVRLHVQAHPTREFSRRHFGSRFGKTEAYVILETRPEVNRPYILFGFQQPPDRREYRRAILEQDTEAILAPFVPVPVQPGDVFLVPGGVPHAIGEGVMMLEVNEPTDLVVRLEFERGGYILPEKARFMDRDVDFALDMLSFNRLSHDAIRDQYFGRPLAVRSSDGGVEYALVDQRLTDCFVVHRVVTDGRFRRPVRDFEVFLVVRGEGEAKGGGSSIQLQRGTRGILAPSAAEVEFVSDHEELEVLIVTR